MGKSKKNQYEDDCYCHDDDKHDDWKYQDDWESSDDKCYDDKDKHKDKDKDKQKDKNEKKDKKEHPKPPSHHKTCVKEVLAAIHEAQKKVKHEDECKTSCDASIKELLGESKKSKKNTIPFMLYCGDCAPFKGTGVTTFTHSKKKKFSCITSYIFRIKELEGKCAVLELLTFKPSKCAHDSFKKAGSSNTCSPCGQIDCENVDDLMRTGICITVDLSCFCAVTCLPAVKL